MEGMVGGRLNKQIAEGLGISPSYVNLIERNQRPVTAQLLLRLAETYDLDLRDLATAAAGLRGGVPRARRADQRCLRFLRRPGRLLALGG